MTRSAGPGIVSGRGMRITGKGGVYHLRFWHEAARDTEGEIVDLRGDALAAESLARTLAASPGASSALRRLLPAESARLSRLDHADLVRLLAAELAAGRVLAVRVPPPALPAFDLLQDEPPPPIEQEEPAKQEKTWIEIELVDEEGKPVPGERYWILLPDGTTREGRLDEKGRAYFGDLDPGECDVRFPDLDNDAVASPGEPKLPRSLPRPKKPRKTWIEIELVGMDGGPIPGQLYRIALPDGTAVEGRLDERGRARVLGIDPGTCSVTFPDLDMEAWEVIA
ncbi:MAG: hypothetical protein R3B70_14615 [Polyangiaceae bacterium]